MSNIDDRMILIGRNQSNDETDDEDSSFEDVN
jgi:hypothetical protein